MTRLFTSCAALVFSVSAFAAPAPGTRTQTYCFKMPSQLGGGIAKIRATYATQKMDEMAITKDIAKLEVLQGRPVLRAATVVTFPKKYINRGKLMRADLVLDDAVFLADGTLTDRISFVASVRAFDGAQYGAAYDSQTRDWTGVDVRKPRLRVAEGPRLGEANAPALALDLVGKSCK